MDMRAWPLFPLGAVLCLMVPRPVSADTAFLHGKVVMEDGSPPGRAVLIQRKCQGMDHELTAAFASPKTGVYVVQLQINDFGQVFSGGMDGGSILGCVLTAEARGFTASVIDFTARGAIKGSELPDIVLTPTLPGALIDADRGPGLPRALSKPWTAALKEIAAKDFAAAEPRLRAVVDGAPTFAPGWLALGVDCQELGKREDARRAFQSAVELDPKPLPAYLQLIDAEIALKDWNAARKTSQTVIDRDSKHLYMDAYIQNAVARYELNDADGALARIEEIIALDRRKEFPRTEYILGLILEARHDYEGAGAHLRNYLQQHPNAKESAAAKDRLANLGKSPPADLGAELTAADMRLSAAGEAPVPGGLKAFAAIAHLKETPSYRDFFLQYCRAIADGGGLRSNPTIEAREVVREFTAAVAELESLGRRDGNRTVIRLEVDTGEHRQKTARILTALGWRLQQSGDSYDITLGNLRTDGSRQRIPAAFGIDELDMRDAIAAKRVYQFEIPTESARLVGGAAWSVVLKGVPGFTGGPVDLFIRDWRFARVYAALAAMESDTASAVVASVGLSTLLLKYSNLVADYGEALALDGNHVAVPGGVAAQAVWARLAGADPQTPSRFFRALFEKDQGRLLAFYFDLARADAAHRQFFTRTSSRAEAVYRWYRENGNRWQAVILQKLPLDAAGAIRFPGGREAWTSGAGDSARSDEDVLFSRPSLQPLAAVLQLEAKRGAAFDAGSAVLLAKHCEEWRYLFPYFEKLPGLAAPEFEALAAFSGEIANAAPRQQDLLLGEWHSLVELIMLGSRAGSLNAAEAAHAFRRVTEALRSADPSGEALAALREVAGGSADIDEALAGGLLRLRGAKRKAFETVKEMQNAPRIDSLGPAPDAAATLAALSGVVYAALLEPGFLLVAEDPNLLSKHAFLSADDSKRHVLFPDSALIASNAAPGSRFIGGFGRFQEAAREMDRGATDLGSAGDPFAGSHSLDGSTESAESGGPNAPPASDAIFRANGRLVEAYATVTDSRGGYVDDLKAGDFTILEEGVQHPAFAFENHTNSVSVALLFDTTGSMEAALPSLKAAAMQLIADLRADDTVSVYGFNSTVAELQPLTADKAAARRAVLRAHAFGTTALYDALLRVNRDLAQHSGKKVILVFTDGNDNASMLTADAAIWRAKGRGIPIYTIAEGEAVEDTGLIGQLANMSRATGGTSFLIRKLSDIATVFQKVSEDLMHGYLLAFQPSPGNERGWRKIEIVLNDGKRRKVRAREGFYAE